MPIRRRSTRGSRSSARPTKKQTKLGLKPTSEIVGGQKFNGRIVGGERVYLLGKKKVIIMGNRIIEID